MPTLPLPTAIDHVAGVFAAAGVSQSNALSVARSLIAAEADGLKGHGLSRVPTYLAMVRTGKIDGKATPEATRPRPSVLAIDAHDGFAYPAIDLALERLPDIARTQGIAIAPVRNSSHCGAAGLHVEKLADAGLVGLLFANTPGAMAPWGGFDHNAQTLRIVTHLEHRYPGWDGLNLAWETLEGLAKHNGPVAAPSWAMQEADADFPLELATYPGLEAQVAALADDIAYDNHDLDDGIRAGLFGVEDVAADVPFTADCWAAVVARWPQVTARRRLVPELVREQIGRMTADLLAETRRRLAEAAPADAAAVRAAGRPHAGFSAALAAETSALKTFLRRRMYRHPKVAALRDPSEAVVAQLFKVLHADPEAMPPGWRETCPAAEPARARHVSDFIAGMTDRYALGLYERLVGPSPLPREVIT